MLRHDIEQGRVDDWTIDAHAQVALAGGYDAAVTGAEATRHARLQGQLRRHATLGAQRSRRLEHRGWAARIDDGVRISTQLGAQEGRDKAPVANRPVVGGQRQALGAVEALTGEQARSLSVVAVAKAEQASSLEEYFRRQGKAEIVDGSWPVREWAGEDL